MRTLNISISDIEYNNFGIKQQNLNFTDFVSIINKGLKNNVKVGNFFPDIKVVDNNNHSLSYSPNTIKINSKQYVFNFPLRCLFEKENNYFVINNELLDIVGTGKTQEEAEENFNEEFDYLYVKLNSLNDNDLSKKLVRIKQQINSYVKEIL